MLKAFEKEYKPLMCGYCGYMTPYSAESRTPTVSGFCEYLCQPVYRADFCHREDEIARHEAAKATYTCEERMYRREPKLPGSK